MMDIKKTNVWIDHTGDECSVEPDTLVRIRMDDENWEAEIYLQAEIWAWGPVTHYMLAPET